MKSIDEIRSEIENYKIENAETLEQFRLQFLSKKSEIQALFGEIKNMAQENRKEFGQLVNDLRDMAQNHYNEFKTRIEAAADKKADLIPDITRPSAQREIGSMHPISLMMNEVRRIFEDIGFSAVEGPDIEDDWHVFTALNFAEEHPARDMQDTFFIELHPDVLLRTHTSSLQVRTMEKQQPPIRVI